MTRARLFWGIFVVGVLVDQAVKLWIRWTIPPHGGLDGLPWPGVFEITHTLNDGIAFGMLQGYGVLLAPVAIAIVVMAAIYSKRHPQESTWVHAAMALLSAGAIGNLYDRVMHGKVTDMFFFKAINFPVFNVADVCISVAAGILILKWGMDSVPKVEPAAVGPETQQIAPDATPVDGSESTLVEAREPGQEVSS